MAAQDATIIAAIARLQAEMENVLKRQDAIEAKLDTLNKARWVGSGFLLALGGGGVYAAQKIAAIVPLLGK